jgi:uncharacterized protein (DUF1501 family)
MNPTEPCGCPSTRRGVSRRGFLGAMGVGALAVAVGPGITQAAFAADTATSSNADTLVILDLRGGMDGLSLVPPIGDPSYAALRPTIAIPASQGLVSSGIFGLHPALAPLLPYWKAGTFGALQAVAQPDETRSHFTSQYELDRAAPDTSLTTGWLDRAIEALGTTDVLQSATLGSGVADRILAGPAPSFAASTLADFTLYGANGSSSLATAIQALHTASPLPWARIAAPTLGCVSTAASVVAAEASPANGAVYPTGDVGSALSNVAQLIRADVGLRFVSVDMGDWDMHQGLGAAGTGWMASQAGALASALAAFAQDIGPTALAHTSVVTISEFGRRAGENGSGGVDHGHGNAMLFLGGGLNGGQVHGTWPGLAAADLDQGDLAGTTDYRDVFADLLTARCGLPTSALSSVFPGYAPKATGIPRTS